MRRTGVLRAPLIRIVNGTFHQNNVPVFRDLSLTIQPQEKWTILSKNASARTSLLQILRGQHVCTPPSAISYPHLASLQDKRMQSAHNAIQYVGFDAERGKGALHGAYASARYESLREETDFSLLAYLTGNTELNPDEALARHPDTVLLKKIMDDLKLHELADMPVARLSNGQTRRAKIAKALLSKPELLLLDGPFMGLDPPTLKHLSQLLNDMAEKQSPRLILSLKPDEQIPEWITHMAFVTSQFELAKAGPKLEVYDYIHDRYEALKDLDKTRHTRALNEESVEYAEVSRNLWMHTPTAEHYVDRAEESAYTRDNAGRRHEPNRQGHNTGKEVISRDGFRVDRLSNRCSDPQPEVGEPIVEMDGVKVQYGDKAVLGNWKQEVNGREKDGLHWNICRGQRWGVFGPNGSGKTTLISLMTSDHPQTYSLPIKLFGRSRLPESGQPGISIFDLQKRIGHSSPEVHVYFPKHLSIRRTLESAWADTPLTKPKLSYDIDEKVNAALSWFQNEFMPSLGSQAWMRAEMDRSVPGVDHGFFDLKQEPTAIKKAGHHLSLAEDLILRNQQDMEGETWPDTVKFGELSFSAQRVALFVRAVIRNPDLVVLDEAFSGMDDDARDKCHLFLSHGQNAIYHYKRWGGNIIKPKITRSDMSRLGMVKIQGLQDSQALIVVSHKKFEVPGCVRNWICLPESGKGAPRFGELSQPLELSFDQWNAIWGEIARPLTIPERNRDRMKELMRSHPDWPKTLETPEQREARIARRRALDPRRSLVGVAVSRARVDYEAKSARRRELHAQIRALETNEERERRLLRNRIGIWARSLAMSEEEREEYKKGISESQKRRKAEREAGMRPEERTRLRAEARTAHYEAIAEASRPKTMTPEKRKEMDAKTLERRAEIEKLKALDRERVASTGRRGRKRKDNVTGAHPREKARLYEARYREKQKQKRAAAQAAGSTDER